MPDHITPPPADTPGDYAGDPVVFDAKKLEWYLWFQVVCPQLNAYPAVLEMLAAAAATEAANAVLAEKVTGPASATANALAKFDGVSGKLLKASVLVEDAAGNLGIGATPIAGLGRAQVAGNMSAGRIGIPVHIQDTADTNYGNAIYVPYDGGSTTQKAFRIRSSYSTGALHFEPSTNSQAQFTNPATLTYGKGFTLDTEGNLLVGATNRLSVEKFGVSVSAISDQVQYLYASNAAYDATMQVVACARPATSAYNFSRYFANGAEVYQVQGNGNVRIAAGSTYGNLSDRKLKDKITDATPKLADVMRLRVRNFTIKGDPSQIKYLGWIAQEFEEVFPSLVSESPDYEEVTRTREVTRTVPVTDKKLVLREQKTVQVLDGKAIVKVDWLEELADVPVIDHYPMFDDAGQPVLEMVTPEVPAVTGADGNVTQPAVAATYRQAMHSVPRMQDVRETETYTERVPTGTVTKGIKESAMIAVLTKTLQEQQAMIEVQQVQINEQNLAMQALSRKLRALGAA